MSEYVWSVNLLIGFGVFGVACVILAILKAALLETKE
jgi:hypothetical protein